MSSPKAASAKASTGKAATGKAPRGKAKAVSGEPSKSEKAAFVKAMWEGIKPGSLAAEKSAAKKGPAAKAAASPKAKKPAEKKAKAEEQPKVEILRRISGAPKQTAPNTAMSNEALALAKSIEAALADGKLEELQPHALQALMAALCKVYAANDDSGNRYPILSGRSVVTGTDVMIVCGSLLRAVDLQVFELGMWQTWSGR